VTGWVAEIKRLTASLTQTKRRLEEITERYALATSAARVGVWDWNLKTGDFYLDPNIKNLLGYEDHEVPNDLEAWSDHIYPDDKEAVMRAAQAAIEGRTAEYVFEHRMRHKDGTVRWFMVRGKVMRDGNGTALRFVGTDTDITERRELEQQIRELSNELQTQIGHDLHDSLGQELTALMLKLAVLESRLVADSSQHAADAREARVLAERATETTGALARGLSPVVGASGLAPSLVQLADNASRIYGIECRVELPEELPTRFSVAQGNEMYRIVQEAITNAVRHGRATHVIIEGRIFGSRFVLNIVDNGVSEDLPDPSTTSMGLKIMQYRARSLGGSLTVSRRRDGGTLVVCSCPLLK